MSDDMASKITAIQLEIENVSEEASFIDSQLSKLLQQQDELNSKKRRLQTRLDRLIEEENEVPEDWTSNDFPWTEHAKKILNERFSIEDFRSLQKEAINVTLSKRDCILIMPTGGGKSLTFQLPSLVDQNGFTLVVSPLISLMEDQLFSLKSLNIDARMLCGSTSKADVSSTFASMVTSGSPLKILYVTPERIAKSKRFMTKLQKSHQLGLLNRIVIDEVHCTSHWGHDFRPDYKILGILKRQYPNVPILGLTATASTKILDDVIDILNLDHRCVIFRASFNRPNLYYEVYHTTLDKSALTKNIANRIQTQFNKKSGIVYCFSRKDCEDVAADLTRQGVRAHCYHADLTADTKSKVHQAWIKGDIQVVVATIAFGMGIDKSNVRFVIHYSISKSIENYYQESGRAGRDDEKSWCIVYFRFQDIFRQSSMVFTEKTGLQNLYNMLEYCLDNTICRRSLVGKYFNEEWSSSKCHKMCDNCDVNNMISEAPLRDLASDGETIVEIINKATNLDERVTPLKIISAWMGTTKTKYRPDNFTQHSKEDCERIMSKLLVEQIVKEDFHFTPYSTITYLLQGPRWPLLKHSKISIKLKLKQNLMSGKTQSNANASGKSRPEKEEKKKMQGTATISVKPRPTENNQKRRPENEINTQKKKKKVVVIDSDSSEDDFKNC